MTATLIPAQRSSSPAIGTCFGCGRIVDVVEHDRRRVVRPHEGPHSPSCSGVGQAPRGFLPV